MKDYIKSINILYLDNLAEYEKNIAEYEELLKQEREKRNTLLQNLQNAYTEKMKGRYFKTESDREIIIGKFQEVYFKSGKFYIHAFKVDVTENGKVRMIHCKFELSDVFMEKTKMISEEEYKLEFYDYVNKRILVLSEMPEIDN